MSYAITILETQRNQLIAQIKQAEQTLRDQRASLRSIEDALNVLAGSAPPTYGAPKPKTEIGKGTFKDLVVDVIVSRQSGISTTDILTELETRARPTDRNSLLSTLSRAKRDDRTIYKNAAGLWVPTVLSHPLDDEPEGPPDDYDPFAEPETETSSPDEEDEL